MSNICTNIWLNLNPMINRKYLIQYLAQGSSKKGVDIKEITIISEKHFFLVENLMLPNKLMLVC